MKSEAFGAYYGILYSVRAHVFYIVSVFKLAHQRNVGYYVTGASAAAEHNLFHTISLFNFAS